MKIVCEKCKAIIPAENIDFKRNLAKCTLCDNVFNCAGQLDSVESKNESGRTTRKVEKPEVEVPKNMKVSPVENGFQMAYKWFSAKFIFLTVFCLFWDGILGFFIGISLSAGEYQILAFISVHLLVGIGLTYYTIAGYINWSVINITRENINVRLGPMPWPGNKSIASDDIDQLYCKKKITRSRNGGTTVTYEVRLITKEKKDIKLVGGLSNSDLVFYIEQEIEKYYRIIDRAVDGEITR